MSNNLKEEMQAFSDQRILNNIKQQNSFSPASVEIAKEIASERGLLNEAQISDIDHEASTGQTQLHESKGSSTLSTWTVLLIIFIVVRIILRLTNS